MKRVVKIEADKLATGIRDILLDMKRAGKEPSYPVKEFERLIMESKGVSKKEAEKVTEAVINTGIIQWEIYGNNFIIGY